MSTARTLQPPEAEEATEPAVAPRPERAAEEVEEIEGEADDDAAIALGYN